MLKMKGVAGLYVGWEQHTDEPKIVSKAWFRELAPPWRNGIGVRLRIGHRALQVGRYRKSREENPTALSQLGGRELPFDPQAISSWQGPSKVDTLSTFHPVGWTDQNGLHYFKDQDSET